MAIHSSLLPEGNCLAPDVWKSEIEDYGLTMLGSVKTPSFGHDLRFIDLPLRVDHRQFVMLLETEVE